MEDIYGSATDPRDSLSRRCLLLSGDVRSPHFDHLCWALTYTSPRWLVEHGRSEAAKRSLAYLRALEPSNELVLRELREIEQDVEQRKVATRQSWTMLFTHRPLFNRLWRASLLSFMGQMAGNTSMKYYLPTIFMGLGIERKITLLVAGIETTLKIGCTVFDSWLVDRYGRTRTLVASCFIMSFSLLVSETAAVILPSLTEIAA